MEGEKKNKQKQEDVLHQVFFKNNNNRVIK